MRSQRSAVNHTLIERGSTLKDSIGSVMGAPEGEKKGVHCHHADLTHKTLLNRVSHKRALSHMIGSVDFELVGHVPPCAFSQNDRRSAQCPMPQRLP